MIDTLISASILANESKFLERFPRFLLSETEKKAVNWCVNYSRKFRHMPTKERFETTEFSVYFTTYLTASPLEDIYDQAIEYKRQEYFNSKINEIAVLTSGGETLNPDVVIKLGRELSSVSSEEDESVHTIDRTSLYSDEIENDFKFGYATLDNAIGGLKPSEVCVLVARTGVGKTLITCDFALKAAREGKRVLFISAEMANIQIATRLDAMLGSFNPKILRTKSNPALMAAAKRVVDMEWMKIKETGGDIIFPKRSAASIGKIASKIIELRPDIVIVDGLYLIKSGDNNSQAADWQKMKSVSNELKQIALDESVPVFGTTQLKRTGKEDSFSLEDIAFSDSIGQDADVVLVANRFAGAPSQLTLEIMKNRNGDSYGGVVLDIDWNNMTLTETTK